MHDASSLVAISESFSEEIAQSLATLPSVLTVSKDRPGTASGQAIF